MPVITGAVDESGAHFRAALDAGDGNVTGKMHIVLANAKAELNGSIAKIQAELQQAADDGITLSPARAFQQARLQAILADVESSMAVYGPAIGNAAADVIPAGLKLGTQHAAEMLSGELGIAGAWAGLNDRALADLQGRLEKTTPLGAIYSQFGEQVRGVINDELTRGLILGQHPSVIARNMEERGAGFARWKGEQYARDALIDSYHAASLETYRGSADRLLGWRWLSARQPGRTCVSCLANDGSIWPLTESLPRHSRCRCTMVPVRKGTDPNSITRGQDIYDSWTPEEQQMYGPGVYDLLNSGMPLQDFVQQTVTKEFGRTFTEAAQYRAKAQRASREAIETLDGITYAQVNSDLAAAYNAGELTESSYGTIAARLRTGELTPGMAKAEIQDAASRSAARAAAAAPAPEPPPFKMTLPNIKKLTKPKGLDQATALDIQKKIKKGIITSQEELEAAIDDAVKQAADLKIQQLDIAGAMLDDAVDAGTIDFVWAEKLGDDLANGTFPFAELPDKIAEAKQAIQAEQITKVYQGIIDDLDLSVKAGLFDPDEAALLADSLKQQTMPLGDAQKYITEIMAGDHAPAKLLVDQYAPLLDDLVTIGHMTDGEKIQFLTDIADAKLSKAQVEHAYQHLKNGPATPQALTTKFGNDIGNLYSTGKLDKADMTALVGDINAGKYDQASLKAKIDLLAQGEPKPAWLVQQYEPQFLDLYHAGAIDKATYDDMVDLMAGGKFKQAKIQSVIADPVSYFGTPASLDPAQILHKFDTQLNALVNADVISPQQLAMIQDAINAQAVDAPGLEKLIDNMLNTKPQWVPKKMEAHFLPKIMQAAQDGHITYDEAIAYQKKLALGMINPIDLSAALKAPATKTVSLLKAAGHPLEGYADALNTLVGKDALNIDQAQHIFDNLQTGAWTKYQTKNYLYYVDHMKPNLTPKAILDDFEIIKKGLIKAGVDPAELEAQINGVIELKVKKTHLSKWAADQQVQLGIKKPPKVKTPKAPKPVNTQSLNQPGSPPTVHAASPNQHAVIPGAQQSPWNYDLQPALAKTPNPPAGAPVYRYQSNPHRIGVSQHVTADPSDHANRAAQIKAYRQPKDVLDVKQYEHTRDVFQKAATKTEQAALQSYTGSSYSEMNKWMRKGIQGSKSIETKIQAIDDAFQRPEARMIDDFKLYRGTGFSKLPAEIANLKPGDVLVDHGVTSFSGSKGTANSFGLGKHNATIYEIFVPKGARGVYAKPFSNYASESEVMLPRMNHMLVHEVRMENGVRHIVAELLID